MKKHPERNTMQTYLLVAVNAKYIHSNLAVYSLKSYAKKQGFLSDYVEYTINQSMGEVLRDLYEKKPGLVAFSCYIWNIEFILRLCEELSLILPACDIWLGGPEVSYNPEERLKTLPFVKGIMVGEGEKTWTELIAAYEKSLNLSGVKGLALRNPAGGILHTGFQEALSMDELVFPYDDLSELSNRIVYYESSRGCPFSCSYCLSSIEKCLRFRSLDKVFFELSFFIEKKVPQVKFIDRTFNCNHKHAMAIWNFIKERDLGFPTFHFELSADLLKEEDLLLLSSMRPGLVQLEIGVQSTNPDTIKAIGRSMDLVKLKKNVDRVRAGRNIHQHLDLIAGLPYEGLESFKNSFNDIYAMKPDQLQLGFLKVLKGTRMEKEALTHDIVHQKRPVYEVLSTKWLSYEDIIRLKTVEETVEEYYNSGQFGLSLKFAEKLFDSPFDLYLSFGNFLREEGYRKGNMNRVTRYLALRDFLKDKEIDQDLFDSLLSVDYCLRERLKKPLPFTGESKEDEKMTEAFLSSREEMEKCFPAEHLSVRQFKIRCQTLILRRDISNYLLSCGIKAEGNPVNGPYMVIFDYDRRDPLDHNAKMIIRPVGWK